MHLLSVLLITSLIAVSTSEPLFRFLSSSSSNEAGYGIKRAPRMRELFGKRDSGWDYPVKRARELFGKRNGEAEKRKPRELFGKRSAPEMLEDGFEDIGAQDYVYDEELVRALNGLKRERRARVRELLG